MGTWTMEDLQLLRDYLLADEDEIAEFTTEQYARLIQIAEELDEVSHTDGHVLIFGKPGGDD